MSAVAAVLIVTIQIGKMIDQLQFGFMHTNAKSVEVVAHCLH
jgi:hypothetical protein